MVLAEYFGRNSYGTILGIFSPLQMVALGAGPALASAVKMLAGNYTVLYLAMMAAYFLSAILMYLARPPRHPARADAGALAPAD